MPGLLLAFGTVAEPRPDVIEELMKKAHPEEPHWYLAVIGSDPTSAARASGRR